MISIKLDSNWVIFFFFALSGLFTKEYGIFKFLCESVDGNEKVKHVNCIFYIFVTKTNPSCTMPRKNMNPLYSIRMYWTNFWQPTVYVPQNIFEKPLIEVGSLHIYASFGTFCVQISQLFEASTESLWKMYENGKIALL